MFLFPFPSSGSGILRLTHQGKDGDRVLGDVPSRYLTDRGGRVAELPRFLHGIRARQEHLQKHPYAVCTASQSPEYSVSRDTHLKDGTSGIVERVGILLQTYIIDGWPLGLELIIDIMCVCCQEVCLVSWPGLYVFLKFDG